MTYDRETCDHCGHAMLAPNWPLYRAQCKGCAIRALASSPSFYESSKKGTMTQTYKDGLETIFGKEWLEGHKLVKSEFDRAKALRDEHVPSA